MKNQFAVIMAGGVGSRFWPLSKEALPKQFLDLLGTGQTLLQITYERLAKIVPPENIFILTNDQYSKLVKEELPQITARQIVLEPVMRNTAPCILLSTMKIHKENPDAEIIISPSDHWIEQEERFVDDVKKGFAFCAQNDSLLTLGIRPTQPHTGYGYIKFMEGEGRVKRVRRFTEKPNVYTAQSFIDSGDYLWNAGIFIAQAESLLRAYQKYLPEMLALFKKGEDTLNTDKEEAFLRANYAQAENISIDYALMEKADNVKVLPVTFDWNDLGSWGSLYDKLPKDKNRNVIVNTQTYIENSEGNIIHTPKGRVVVLKDLQNYIVVENEQVLMIYPREKEQEIKSVRSKVLKRFGQDLG